MISLHAFLAYPGLHYYYYYYYYYYIKVVI